VLAGLTEPTAAKPAAAPLPAAPASEAAQKRAHTRENPFYAELVDKQILTTPRRASRPCTSALILRMAICTAIPA
jgi:hypothetical protein